MFNNPLQFKVQGCGAQPKTHDIIACDVTDKESFDSVKDWTGEIDKLHVENECAV